MALRAAPTPITALRGSTTRRSDRRTEAADLRDELTARRAEAIAFCDNVAPLVRALEPGAIELGPRHHQTVVMALARIERYRRQQTNEAA